MSHTPSVHTHSGRLFSTVGPVRFSIERPMGYGTVGVWAGGVWVGHDPVVYMLVLVGHVSMQSAAFNISLSSGAAKSLPKASPAGVCACS